MKPVTYAANVAEGDLGSGGAGNHHVAALREKAALEGREVVIVSAQVRRRRPVPAAALRMHTDRLLDSTTPQRPLQPRSPGELRKLSQFHNPPGVHAAGELPAQAPPPPDPAMVVRGVGGGMSGTVLAAQSLISSCAASCNQPSTQRNPSCSWQR